MIKLTNKTDVPFELFIKDRIQSGYTFKELSQSNNKEFQSFLDKVSRMTVQQVDMQFSRKPDKTDIYNGMQVYHYEITKKFRIHVVIQNGRYMIIRLDPNHKVHN